MKLPEAGGKKEKHLLLKVQSEVSTICDDSLMVLVHINGAIHQEILYSTSCFFSDHVFHGEPDFILQQLPTQPKIPTAGLLAMELLCLVGQ